MRFSPLVLTWAVAFPWTVTGQCSLCWDESQNTLPNKSTDDILGLSPLPLNATTCDELADAIKSSLTEESEECKRVQVTWGGLCGCPRIPESCELCPEQQQISSPNNLYTPWTEWFNQQNNNETMERIPTCMETSHILSQLQKDNAQRQSFIVEDFCRLVQSDAQVCGCAVQKESSSVASNTPQRVALAWTPRITGFLSFLGSVLILRDVTTAKEVSIYQGLVAGLSVSDICSSLVWIVSTAPVPKDFEVGEGTDDGVHGAVGNDATCTAQGFFMEMGFIGSISYNFVLCVYYLLVIVYDKKETDLKRYRWPFHLIPGVAALTMALAGIPGYAPSFLSCRVAGDSAIYNRVLVIAPLAIVTCGVTIIMLRIYWHVRQTTRVTQRWDFERENTPATTVPAPPDPEAPSSRTFSPRASARSMTQLVRKTSIVIVENVQNATGTPTRMEKMVFWQCFFFLIVFYVTWAFFYVSQFWSTLSFWFWLTVVFFTPLQGFFNAMVYIRPRLSRHLQNKRRQRKQRKRAGVSALSEARKLGDGTSPYQHPVLKSELPTIQSGKESEDLQRSTEVCEAPDT